MYLKKVFEWKLISKEKLKYETFFRFADFYCLKVNLISSVLYFKLQQYDHYKPPPVLSKMIMNCTISFFR